MCPTAELQWWYACHAQAGVVGQDGWSKLAAPSHCETAFPQRDDVSLPHFRYRMAAAEGAVQPFGRSVKR
jgi:hypothetical protein